MNETMDYNIIAMAATLKNWRIGCGLTLYRIAKEVGLDPHTLARIEKGENVHSSALLKYIGFARKADPNWDIVKEWENTRRWLLEQRKG